MKKRYFIKAKHIIFMFLGVLLVACNNDFKKIIPDNEGEDIDVIYGEPKVLLLVADGIRGEAIKGADIPNITALLPHSIYSWNSLSEENAKDVTSNWMNIFTGVNYVKHGVIDEDLSNNQLSSFPLIFDRVKEFDEDADIRIISAEKKFLDIFGTDVDSQQAQDDENVKDKIIEELKKDDVSFLTGHFQDVFKAGEASGYDNSFSDYKAAIEDFDGYVGEVLDAVRERSAFSKEDWLIIITSSQGGEFEIPEEEDDKTIFSDPAVNTFTVMYSPKFSENFIGKPYIGNKFVGDFMKFKGEFYAELQEGDNQLYDLGDEDFTIELKIKKNKGPNNNYSFSHPSVIGKRAHWQPDWDKETDGIGWVVHLSSESWIFNARGDKGTGEIKAEDKLNRGTWNTLTVTGQTSDGVRKVNLYTNGELSKEGDITGWGSIESDANLRIGFLPNKNTWRSDAYIADVKIWKTSLPGEVVREYSCDIGVDPNHPYYNYLAGYWPIMGTDNTTVFDEGPFGSHLSIGGGDAVIDRLNDYICAPSSEDLGAFVPRTIDISTQIISWLKVPRQIGWQLDGRVWLGK